MPYSQPVKICSAERAYNIQSTTMFREDGRDAERGGCGRYNVMDWVDVEGREFGSKTQSQFRASINTFHPLRQILLQMRTHI